MTPRHETARAYAAQGIPVFPCQVGGKKPATRRGFLDRTTNTVQIDRWWGRADFNVAIVPEDMGCGVVDLDPKDGGIETWQALTAERPVPATYQVRTPSGGLHLYFYGSLPASARRLGEGIDTRGRASYVLAPSSIVDGREYVGDVRPIAEMPEWIATAFTSAKVEPRKAAEGVELDLPYSIAEAERWLLTQVPPVEGQGSDDYCYRVAARLKDFGLSPETSTELMGNWAPHFDTDWIEEKTAHAESYGQNEAGSDRPRSNDEMFEAVELPEEIRPIENPEELFSTGAALYARDPKPVEELIPGLIEKHCVTYLAGPGGVSKSRIAHHWGSCVHAGLDLYGRTVERATFVYVSYENGEDEDARRHRKVVERLELDPAQLAGYVYCGWKDKPPLLIVPESGNLQPTPLWHALESKLRSIPGHKFIVFDSAYNVFGFVGNAKINESAVQRAINWLDNRMRDVDGTGLFIMHPSHAGRQRGDMSGWSVAWDNAPRAKLGLGPVKDSDDTVELSVVKRNNRPKGKPITLRWNDGLLLPDTSGSEDRAIQAAVIDLAISRAENGVPFTKTAAGKRMPGRGDVEQIAGRCGITITPGEISKRLTKAATYDGTLRYREFDDKGKKPAGYYPAPAKEDEPW